MKNDLIEVPNLDALPLKRVQFASETLLFLFWEMLKNILALKLFMKGHHLELLLSQRWISRLISTQLKRGAFSFQAAGQPPFSVHHDSSSQAE